MNQVLETINKRRSLRVYKDQPLTAEEKQAILQAAMRAPTAGNMMLYSMIEVEDQGLKDKLAETCDHQPFIARAPFVVLFLADYQRWFDLYTISGAEARCRELGKTFRKPHEGDLLLACCDALIAAQNAVIAAESLGIGSCYIGDILENYEVHREMFQLPPYVLPITMLCFGYPASEFSERLTDRFDPQFVSFKNTYRRLSPEDFQQMFAAEEKRIARYVEGAQNIGQHHYFRKFNADFSVEMNRSVREMLKNWE